MFAFSQVECYLSGKHIVVVPEQGSKTELRHGTYFVHLTGVGKSGMIYSQTSFSTGEAPLPGCEATLPPAAPGQLRSQLTFGVGTPH